MPIMGNIGNLFYVLVAFIGALLIINNVPNVGLHMLFGVELSLLPIVVTFLGMTKNFVTNVSQVSQQINFVVMAMAGAERVFEMMDEEPEVDHGYVTLVNAREENGELVECEERTGIWAWKHPHEDGSVTYTRLAGDVRLSEVDFGYVPEKIVLHDITLYAKPGQKVAFVGATGAGKTTITNLINRFYDIADGKIRYDGININKIKKADLRRSLGIVLQDTNLFTGSVMDNSFFVKPLVSEVTLCELRKYFPLSYIYAKKVNKKPINSDNAPPSTNAIQVYSTPRGNQSVRKYAQSPRRTS